MAISRPRIFTKNPERVEEVTSPLDSTPEVDPGFRDEMPVLGKAASGPLDADVYVSVVIRIPQSLHDEYKNLATKQELNVEDLIAYRLQVCKNHSALRGLWFSDSERAQLENYLQKWPLETASQALTAICKAGTVRIDDVEITLSPAQKKTLGFAMFGGRTPKSFFEAMIKKELRA